MFLFAFHDPSSGRIVEGLARPFPDRFDSVGQKVKIISLTFERATNQLLIWVVRFDLQQQSGNNLFPLVIS